MGAIRKSDITGKYIPPDQVPAGMTEAQREAHNRVVLKDIKLRKAENVAEFEYTAGGLKKVPANQVGSALAASSAKNTTDATRQPGRATTSGFSTGDQSPSVKPQPPYASDMSGWLGGAEVSADPGFSRGNSLPGGLAAPDDFVAPKPGAVSMGSAIQFKAEAHAEEYEAEGEDGKWSDLHGSPKSRRILNQLRQADEKPVDETVAKRSR